MRIYLVAALLTPPSALGFTALTLPSGAPRATTESGASSRANSALTSASPGQKRSNELSDLTSSALRGVATEARRQGDRLGSRAARAQERARALRRAEHNPRGEVLGSLLNDAQKQALLAWLPPWLQSVRARMIGYTRQKEAILRWRIAQQRALVDKAAREIDALEARVEKMQSTRPQIVESIRARISQRRRDAGAAEALILGYKRRLGSAKGARRPGLLGEAARAAETFSASEERAAKVLWSALRGQADPWALLREDTFALLRLGSNLTLASGYARLSASPRLMPHAAAIVARASKLERFAPGILLAIDGYLDLIEPHLDDILERFEQIEPILPFVLDHLEVITPHAGILLDHFDALMLYADEDGRYLEELIEFLPVFAPKFDALGPHLALLRPHLDKLLPHLSIIAPVADRFAPYVAVSANADVLFWYLGWVLRVPVLGGWTLRLPFVPRVANWLARRLPRRPVRGFTWDYECCIDPADCDVVEYEQRLQWRRAIAATAPERSPRTAITAPGFATC